MNQKFLISEVISTRLRENLDRQDAIRCYFNEFLYLDEENDSLIDFLRKNDIALEIDVATRLS